MCDAFIAYVFDKLNDITQEISLKMCRTSICNHLSSRIESFSYFFDRIYRKNRIKNDCIICFNLLSSYFLLSCQI